MTHPIQYHSPWLRLLAADESIDLTVFYAMLPNAQEQGAGFGVSFEWDVPVLEGYRHHLLENVAKVPSVYTFGGCDSPEIFRLFKQQAWDLLVINGWNSKVCLQALMAARLNRIKVYVRGTTNALRPRGLKTRLAHRALMSLYDGAFYLGTSNRQFYLQAGMKYQQLALAGHAVDNDRFIQQRCHLQREEERAHWGVSNDTLVFVFSGKLEQKKRPLEILTVVARLAKQLPPGAFHVLMAGDGPLRKPCETLIEQQGLPVTLLGFLNQTEIAKVYVAGDCLLLPSDYGETWGLVVNEAMLFGCAAIVSDQVGCWPDLVRDGETGFVAPFAELDGLYRHMQFMIEHPQRCRAMGLAGQKLIEQQYSQQQVYQATRNVALSTAGGLSLC